MKTSSKIYLGLTGALLATAGILAIVNPGPTLQTIAWFAGALTILSGVFTFMSWSILHFILPRPGATLLSAILQVTLGIIMINHNLFVSVWIMYLFAALLVIEGLNLVLRSIDFKKVGFSGWFSLFLLGLLVLAGGVLCLLDVNIAGVTISLIVGIAFILFGLFYVVALLGVNRFERQFDRLR